MEVKITISDDSKFNEVIQKELDAFTPQELHDIVGKAIYAYLSDETRLNELFFKQVTDRWGYTSTVKTEFFEKLIPKDANDITDELREAITARLKEVLTSNKQIQAMIQETWLANLTDTITSRLTSDYALKGVVQQVLADMSNPR